MNNPTIGFLGGGRIARILNSPTRAAAEAGYHCTVVAELTATRDLPDGRGGVIPSGDRASGEPRGPAGSLRGGGGYCGGDSLNATRGPETGMNHENSTAKQGTRSGANFRLATINVN